MAITEVGSEITLASNTESGTIPDIAALHNGTYVVVWETSTGGGSIIRGQMFSASGVLVGSEFTVSQAVTPGTFYKDPAIAVLANGDFVVGWGSGANPTDDGINVYAQRFNQAGATQGSVITLNTETNTGEGGISLAALSSGGFVAAWHEMSLDVDARVFDATGNATTAEFNLATSSQAVEMVGVAGGNFVAIWNDAAGFDIGGGTYSSSGALVSSPLSPNSFQVDAEAHVAAFSDGSFVVVWSEFDTTLIDGSRYAVRAQRYEADGDKDGSAVDVAISVAGGGQALDPRVATLPDGGFVVTWDEFTGFAESPDIYARQFDANDAPVTNALVVDNVVSEFQKGASIAADDDGNLMIAWMNAGLAGEAADIHTQVFTTGTGPVEPTWTTIDSLHDKSPTEGPGGASPFGGGVVTSLEGGGYVALYEVTNVGIAPKLVGHIYGADGEFSRQVTIEPANPDWSQVLSLSDGGFVAAWKEGFVGDTFVQRFDAAGDKVGGVTANPGAFYVSPGNDPVLVNWPYHVNNGLTRSEVIKLADGRFLEIWQDNPVTSLMGQFYDANLMAVGAPVTINAADGNTRDLRLQDIGQLDNGNFAVVVADTADRIIIGEATITSLWVLDPNLAFVSVLPAFLGERDQIVTVEGGFLRVSLTNTKELIAQFYTNAGVEVGTPQVFNDVPAFVTYNELIALENGDFVATWDATSLQQLRLYAEVNGDGNANTLNGSAGHDIIRGGAGIDELNGGMGADVLLGGADADVLNGGGDIDTADYSDASAGVGVDLDDLGSNTGFASGDSYVSIERIVGSKFQDVLSGNGADNVLDGGAGDDLLSGGGGADGDDTLIGGLGDDLLLGGTGADELDGGAGFDTASYATASERVVANLSVQGGNEGDAAGDTFLSVERIIGSAFGDNLRVGALISGSGVAGRDAELQGGDGDDLLVGGDAHDVLLGGDGADTLKGGLNKDTIDGGSNIDTADYSDKVASVTVTLNKATAADVIVSGVSYAEDSIKNVENLIGGSKGDKFTGDGRANVFEGMAGKDILDGKAGADTANYSEKTQKVTVALDSSSFVYVYVNGAKEDRIRNIENVTGGSGADRIAGDGEANILSGLGGKDILVGADGKDTLIGGAGKDTLDGGADADRFRFDALLGASNVDHILSFTAGSDKIELENGIFDVGPSLSAGEFIAKASGHVATKKSQRIVYDESDGSLWYDPTGKAHGATDAIKFAILGNKPNLAVDDFTIV